ncbi:hypothetical protein EDD15DRAFT_2199206 [Pisolithus albus]|nr:hypothetical protein EDD15DRAFT_2199206 [Pisolithus albus]
MTSSIEVMEHSVGSLIQYTADQITLLLKAICQFDLYTCLCLKEPSLEDLQSMEDDAMPHMLLGFISDDATTAFHVIKKPNFADKPLSYVQALPPSDVHPYGKCDTVLACVTSPSGAQTVLIVQVHAVFALSTRGNALPPALSYPFLYVQCFAFMATPSEQLEIGMYTIHFKLIPRYGATANQNVTSETSLEVYDKFYLNSLSTKEFYYTVHNDL